MDKIKVYCDLDNTLRPTNKKALSIFKTLHPDVPIVSYEEMTTPNVTDCVPPEYRDEMHRILQEPGFFLNIEPIPGAREAVLELSKICDFRILTSPYKMSLTCKDENKDWALTYLNRKFKDEMKQEKDKTKVNCHRLIEDKISFIGEKVVPSWDLVIYDQPWNIDFQGPRIKRNWSNGVEIIKQEIQIVLDKAHERSGILECRGMGDDSPEIVDTMFNLSDQ